MHQFLVFFACAVIGIHAAYGQVDNMSAKGDSLPGNHTNRQAKNEIRETKDYKMTDYPHLRVAVSGGLSNHTHQVFEWAEGDIRDYFDQLTSGTNVGLDFHYYFLKPIGLGVHYIGFNSSAKSKNWSTSEDGEKVQKLSIRFIGPSLSTRLLHCSNKNTLFFNGAYGYIDYRNIGLVGLESSIRGNSWGMLFNVGYDLGITENFALGFQLSYLNSSLDEIRLVEGGHKQTFNLKAIGSESLNRFDYSIGMRFNL